MRVSKRRLRKNLMFTHQRMQMAGSFKNISAVVENTKVSPVHDVSKFNPYHDELGRFTSGGAGRRVSRMPKSKSKNKSNAQAEKIVSQLTAKLGKDVADKLNDTKDCIIMNEIGRNAIERETSDRYIFDSTVELQNYGEQLHFAKYPHDKYILRNDFNAKIN